ncbi:unnamed protein product [Paramecium primaurelia]|uniref:Calpain catalytic domain-containing protein n=1 Tax=Paramecium primaurelia TaxID=5886 RepID=A0A8S1P4Z0_PARPR|nr:unnamed protein product [Paramecium primaurelia]
MQYSDRKNYDNALEYFQQANKKDFELKDINDISNLVLSEFQQLNIMKSYLPDYNLKASDFNCSFLLVNVFNIVQQKMRNLKQLFEQREDGLYGVWLWKQGEQYLIIVDDQIPCKLCGNNSQLATVISKYEWPIIMEKAIGKILGLEYNSLNLIQNDSIEYYLQMITGSEIQEQEIQSIEELQKKVRDQQQIYYVKYTQDSKTIASVIAINNEQENQKLVKLIAPNQQSVFLKGRQKHESSCYLTWDEFKQHFQTVYVLIWKDEYRVTPVTLKNPIERKFDFIEHTYCYKFIIDDNANYQITLWQNNLIINQGKIQIKDEKLKNQLGLIRMLLFQELNQNQYQFIDGICDFQSNISINTILDKGNYCILCQGYFNNVQNYTEEQQLEQFKLNLTIKGLQVPQNIDPDNLDKQKQIKLIRSLIKKVSQKENTRSFNIIGQPQIQVITKQIYGFLYFYYENRGTIDIREKIEFIQLGHLINYESLKKKNKELIDIKQNNFKIILYTLDPKIILQQDTINFQYQYKHILIKENEQLEEFDQITQNIELDEFNQIIQNQNTKKIVCDFIDAYINQYQQGITILFQNNQENSVEVDLKFKELKNLRLVQNSIITTNDKSIRFSLEKQSKVKIQFDINEHANNYHYKMDLNCSNNLY